MRRYIHIGDLMLNTLLQYVVQKSARSSSDWGDCLILGGSDRWMTWGRGKNWVRGIHHRIVCSS